MFGKLLAPVAVLFTVGVTALSPLTPIGEAQAANKECKVDGDCAAGEFCIVALNPPVCKAPQAAGAPCKRDVVCASKKCDIPAGKDAGVCK